MFQLDSGSRVPIYEQIKENVVRLAATGVLRPHDQLPPVRTLALQLGINPNTAAKAYREMEAAGWIYSVVGRGSFLSEKLVADNAQVSVTLNDFSKLCQKARHLGIDEETLLAELKQIYEGGQEK